MTYRTAVIPMTLSDLQCHASIAGLLKCNFSYSCAAGDKSSIDLERRAVPLRSRVPCDIELRNVTDEKSNWCQHGVGQ